MFGVPIYRLIWMGVRTPSAAARMVIAWDLPRSALWSMLALVCIGNAIATWGMFATIPMLDPEISAQIMAQSAGPTPPLITFVQFASFMVIASHVLHWMGSLLGGAGRLNDVVAVMTFWVAIQITLAAFFILSLFILPILSMLVGFAMIIIVPWTLVRFLNEATQLKSLWKAIAVIFTALVGTILGLSFFLTLTGLATLG